MNFYINFFNFFYSFLLIGINLLYFPAEKNKTYLLLFPSTTYKDLILFFFIDIAILTQ